MSRQGGERTRPPRVPKGEHKPKELEEHGEDATLTVGGDAHAVSAADPAALPVEFREGVQVGNMVRD